MEEINEFNEIIIESIIIENFMGIEKKTFNLSKRYNEFQGFNGVGKTTVLNAINWCLFNKDLFDRKVFKIFRIDENGETRYDLIPKVTLVILANGDKYELTRYITIISGNRQSCKMEVNGLGYNQKDFSIFLDEKLGIADEEFKLLSNINYAINLPQQKLRTLITNLVGSLSDEEMFEDETVDKRFAPIKKQLLLVGVDMLEKQLSRSKSAHKKEELEKVGAIKQEEENVIKFDIGEEQARNLLERKKELKEQYSDYESVSEKEKKKQKDIDDTVIELDKKKTEFEFMKNSILLLKKEGEILKKELESVASIESIRNSEITRIEADMKIKEFELSSENEKLISKKDRYDELLTKYNSFVSSGISVVDDKCPTCGQKLPKETLKEKLNELKEDKERKKKLLEEKIAELRLNYTSQEEKVNEVKKEIIKLNKEKIDVVQKDLSYLVDDEKSKEIKNSILEKKKEFEKGKNTLALLKDEIEQLRERLENLPEPKIIKEPKSIKIEIDNIDYKLRNYDYVQEHKDNIESLIGEKEEIDKKIIKIEYAQQMLVDYKSLKAERMTHKLQSNFKYIDFKTKEFTKDGEAVDCFKITMDEKDFSTLSSGEKLKCSIDLCVGIQNLKRKKVPLLIDTIGELDKFPNFVNTQAIGCRCVQKPSDSNSRKDEIIGAFSELRLKKGA